MAEAILRPLEDRYSVPDIAGLEKKGVRQVVVLTGGGYPIQGELLSSAFPHASAYRFLGGIELSCRLGQDCKIIFSGSSGRASGAWTTASTMKDLALILMSGRQVMAEAESGNTGEHPAAVKPLLDKGEFILVTSAYHMPRAIRSFEKVGLRPIPYPVDFLSLGNYRWGDWIPSVESLSKLNVALREYLATIFYYLST